MAKKVEEKKNEKKTSNDKAYHVAKRKEDGKWAIKLEKGEKVIKLFDTKIEAENYARQLAENQDARFVTHASKGKNKGKIQKSR